jgi:hypothetical protein
MPRVLSAASHSTTSRLLQGAHNAIEQSFLGYRVSPGAHSEPYGLGRLANFTCAVAPNYQAYTEPLDVGSVETIEAAWGRSKGSMVFGHLHITGGGSQACIGRWSTTVLAEKPDASLIRQIRGWL